MKKLITTLTLIIISTVFFFSCNLCNSKINNDPFTDGIVNDVWDFISEDDLFTIENTLGIPIYRGENPPNIEDIFGVSSGESITFLMNPLMLVKTTVPNDQGFDIPRRFNDLYVKLSNQNLSDYSIDMALTHPNDPPFLGTSGFIVGESNRFTIFGPLVQQVSGHEVKMIHVMSGRIGNDALTNLNFGILMIDNDGAPGKIPNDKGRRFIDQDGVSARAVWPHSSFKNTTANTSKLNNRKDDATSWIYGLQVNN